MLVLALQFSRCDMTLTEPAPEGEARRSGVVRCCFQLPQNGREDGDGAATLLVRRDRIPATLEVCG
jgi:hypothetical protein